MPDLDKLAEEHQNFDALMDAYADEKVRKRRKFYRAGSFALVILATAFLSWLYWGYEPANAIEDKKTVETNNLKPTETEEVLPVEPKTQEAEAPIENEAAEKTTKVATVNSSEEVEEQELRKFEKKQPTIEKSQEETEALAEPEVVINERISRDAAPADGLENLYRYLYDEIDLPDSLLKSEDALFLEVGFEVGKTGEISDVTFSKELPQEVATELKRVFVAMPAWAPAMEKGDSVVSVINLPITFQKKKAKK